MYNLLAEEAFPNSEYVTENNDLDLLVLFKDPLRGSMVEHAPSMQEDWFRHVIISHRRVENK